MFNLLAYNNLILILTYTKELMRKRNFEFIKCLFTLLNITSIYCACILIFKKIIFKKENRIKRFNINSVKYKKTFLIICQIFSKL